MVTLAILRLATKTDFLSPNPLIAYAGLIEAPLQIVSDLLRIATLGQEVQAEGCGSVEARCAVPLFPREEIFSRPVQGLRSQEPPRRIIHAGVNLPPCIAI